MVASKRLQHVGLQAHLRRHGRPFFSSYAALRTLLQVCACKSVLMFVLKYVVASPCSLMAMVVPPCAATGIDFAGFKQSVW